MTDSTGMLQFSDKDTPLLESGYTVDDNARALIVALNTEDEIRDKLAKIYIGFMKEAQMPEGPWLNLKIHDQFYTTLNSDDSIGRGFLAVSYAINCGISSIEDTATSMLKRILPLVLEIKSPRAMAYVLLGICNLLKSEKWQMLYPKAKVISEKLLHLYDMSRGKTWYWFEDRLTYCNAVLPHSLFGYYMTSGEKNVLWVAKDTLNFLTDSLFKNGYLNIVGNRGWWIKQKGIPPYDQQPVDAASIALASLQAFIATEEKEYLAKAKLAYNWYWGENINNIPLFNEKTQGCHDALVPGGVNLNQGAEAIISFLMAHQMLEGIQNIKTTKMIPAV